MERGKNREENSGSWKGGRSANYYQRLYKEHLSKVCAICGNVTNLGVHHINGDNTDNRLKNMVVVCRACHAQSRNRNAKGYFVTTPLADHIKHMNRFITKGKTSD